MKKGFIAIFTLTLLTLNVFAQNDPVLMKVDGKDVTKSEFENIFRKNLKDPVITKEALNEYVDLYVKFKLKVREAEELGMDTVSKFQKELAGYRTQLASPYLVDNAMNDELLKEVYERLGQEVRASHILLKLPASPSVGDTARVYQQVMALRARIIEGEDFAAVAKGKGGSEDPSAKQNGGDLGYFTSLQMVYPFENAAYETAIGDVSMPIRTRFGYHIIKVVDKREARGTIRVAHILVLSKDEDDAASKTNAKAKIDEIYGKLNAADSDFSALARQHSDDKASARKGGELPMFGTGRMVEEFADASFALEADNDVSAPFKTQYGWHIVKRLDYQGLPSFEDQKSKLKSRVARDSRSQLTKSSFIAKLKKEYLFEEFPKAWKNLDKQLDTTLFYATWKPIKPTKLKKALYTFNGKEYTQNDFANYLIETQAKEKLVGDPKKYARAKFTTMINDMVMEFEDSRLEQKYPEFRMLMKEYRDGILLFELTDKKVWRKAVEDTAGLQNFYDGNKQNFMWAKRLDAVIYTCADEKISKRVKYLITKGKNNGEIVTEINKDSKLNLKIESSKYQKGDSNIVDQFDWTVGTSADKSIDGQVVFLVTSSVLEPEPKLLKEAKGLVTAKYQDFLETQWVDSLREKYSVEVIDAVLYSIQ
jgi:peptidyl-prolyl cis-trans isomerase SurA